MQDYVVFTDSTADITKEQKQKWQVEIFPFKFILDGKVYYNDLSDRDIPSEEFFKLMSLGKMPSTSQANIEELKLDFEKFLKDGHDILYIAFSSTLSSSYNTSQIAIKELREEYPERKILSVDSLAASMGQGLLAYLASKKRE
jgi:DegV family protein with EDD domain